MGNKASGPTEGTGRRRWVHPGSPTPPPAGLTQTLPLGCEHKTWASCLAVPGTQQALCRYLLEEGKM